MQTPYLVNKCSSQCSTTPRLPRLSATHVSQICFSQGKFSVWTQKCRVTLTTQLHFRCWFQCFVLKKASSFPPQTFESFLWGLADASPRSPQKSTRSEALIKDWTSLLCLQLYAQGHQLGPKGYADIERAIFSRRFGKIRLLLGKEISF